MNRIFLYLLSLSAIMLKSCSSPNTSETTSASLFGSIKTMAEMVNADVTKVALTVPMSSAEMDKLMEEAKRVAALNKVSVYREPNLLVTDLFLADYAKDREVLLIYKGTGKDEYLQVKEEVRKLEQEGLYTGKAREAIARRMGRLLGYPPHHINQLLATNTPFRTLPDFGVRATNLVLYYKDLEKATDFYANTLGMNEWPITTVPECFASQATPI